VERVELDLVKLPVPCLHCSEGAPDPDPHGLVWEVGELDDSGVVYVECRWAHKSAVIFDARRYQMLLRSGAKALLAGFSSESIASLAAALERAYEFYIRVVCRHRSIPLQRIEDTWKEMKSQSERQLGAFMLLYLLEMQKPLPLNPEIPAIRNRTVHQGRIAKEQDARRFGGLVFARIMEIEVALQQYPEAVNGEAEHEVQQQIASMPKGMQHAKMKIMTVLVKDTQATGPVQSFDEYLTALQTSIERGLA